MPIEIAVWRLGAEPMRLPFTPLDSEQRLEEMLASDISMLDSNLLLIGRQVLTAAGKFIDLLALDADGQVVVLELKRDRTPREVVAQLLDYGSWVQTLKDDDLARVFEAYLERYQPQHAGTSLDQAYCEYFDVDEMPEVLNESHELTIVASELDDSTERIINYLSSTCSVRINAVFFRHFHDGDNEYLSRAWLNDPQDVDAEIEDKRTTLPWNGEYYVSFGHWPNGRQWDDARKYGFISAGGGAWYSRTLKMLEPGVRIWVYVPKRGYVGVGMVTEGSVIAHEFLVRDDAGHDLPITQVELVGNLVRPVDNDPGTEEHVVRVEWVKTVGLEDAIREKGFFSNQNSVARPRSKKWTHTVARLKTRFSISD